MAPAELKELKLQLKDILDKGFIQRELNLHRRRWLELLKNCDINVHYHPDKANVVVDALSRLSMGRVSHVDDEKKYLVKEVHQLVRLGVRLVDTPSGGVSVHSSFESSFVVDVKAKKHLDPVKAKHLKPGGLTQSIEILTWKWQAINMDFMLPFEALYGRRCRSPVGWFEVGEFAILVPEIIHEAIEKVRMTKDRLATAYSHQKSYADNRKRNLEFELGDQRVGNVAYELKLPQDLASMHLVFHVSTVKKCLGNPTSILPVEGLGVDENLSYEEVLVDILDRQVKRVRNNEVATVKANWHQYIECKSMRAGMLSTTIKLEME
ncbi:uncharacterized protein [Solanum lycopersicum]|uniref:uncharacterized protein n=1 Tax=Solanum lycopersicum TaxID=4081 RepID=UPI00374A50D5